MVLRYIFVWHIYLRLAYCAVDDGHKQTPDEWCDQISPTPNWRAVQTTLFVCVCVCLCVWWALWTSIGTGAINAYKSASQSLNWWDNGQVWLEYSHTQTWNLTLWWRLVCHCRSVWRISSTLQMDVDYSWIAFAPTTTTTVVQTSEHFTYNAIRPLFLYTSGKLGGWLGGGRRQHIRNGAKILAQTNNENALCVCVCVVSNALMKTPQDDGWLLSASVFVLQRIVIGGGAVATARWRIVFVCCPGTATFHAFVLAFIPIKTVAKCIHSLNRRVA